MENMRDLLDWLGNKRTFSVFDVKDGLFQLDLHPILKECTAIRTVPGRESTNVSREHSSILLAHSSVLSTIFWETARLWMS